MTAVADRPAILTLADAQVMVDSAYDAESVRRPSLTSNSETVFQKRYSRKDDAGEPTENASEAMWRVALNVSIATVLYTDGAKRTKGDAKAVPVVARELDFPFRTLARQYNWTLEQGTKLKEFSALVANGIEAWLGRAQLYYDLLAQLYFIPNSPTWTGAGTPLGQLAACFVLPVEDSLVAGNSAIMKTLQDAVAIQKTGGGNGFSFGRLRPARSRVSTSMGEATGVVGFLSMYNDVFEHISQGGARRGANMGVCPVDHPDVINFINSKVIEGEIANFNISVAITREFMKAVDEGTDWTFRFPRESGQVYPVVWQGETVQSVPARDLYELIIKNAHVIGDPGALFIDQANQFNPCPKWYTLESTNPCGEQWLGPYENCCLGSIAVQHFVKTDLDNGGVSFDWDAYREIVVLATEFLDDVVDANAYVEAVPELEVAAQGGRRIGLGEMGVADALIKLGLRYGSDSGLDFVSQLQEFTRYQTMLTSIERSRVRGAFPRIKESIYDAKLIRELGPGARYTGKRADGSGEFEGFLWEMPKPLFGHKLDFGRPVVDWDLALKRLLAHGIRNSCQNTFAPTGTIASVAGVEGYGCEPVFALAFTRKMMQEGENVELYYLSGLFDAALQEAGFDEEARKEIARAVKDNGGSCQGIDLVPANIREYMVVAADLTPTEHIRMQGVLQAFVDNSISKTINLPNEATVEDVDTAYRLAFTLGCKGVTIYRQGSRQLEVLTTSAAKSGEVEVIDAQHWPIIRPLPIPVEAEIDGMPSRTYTVRTPFGKMRATITQHPAYPGRPFDVELGIGRGGSDVNSFTEAIGRLASLCLRAGVDPEEVAGQIVGIGGTTQEATLRPDKAVSLPDAFGKLLRSAYRRMQAAPVEVLVEMLPETEGPLAVKQPNTGLLCPKCHQANLAQLEGCTSCLTPDCGYSKCG